MSLFSIIPTAYAAGTASSTAAGQHPSPWGTIIMMAAIFVIFYFLLIRPQQKRAKAQRELVNSVGVGDEVTTASGLMGKIIAIDQNIVSLEIAKDVVIKMQKNAISSTLPKGTLKGTADANTATE